MFKFKVFQCHAWDNVGVLIWVFNFLLVSWFGFFLVVFFLVIVSLDSPWRRLSCFETEALALFSPYLICYIYKAFSKEPDVVCKQTPPARRAGGTWVQYMRAAFVIPDWHGDLWSVRPSCLWRTPAFTCVSRVYFSCPGDTVSESPAMVLRTLWRVNGGSSPSLSKKGNQVMTEKLGEEREVSRLLCHCFAHSVTPHTARTVLMVQKGTEAVLQRLSFGFDGLRMKML